MIRSLTIGALVALLASSSGAAAPSRDSLLVSTRWLAQHLNDPNLVLLHVGEKPEYDARHIAGARFVGTRDVSVSGGANGLTLEMPPADTLRSELASLGISDNSRVVVYYGKDWFSPSTRILFTMLYAGLEHVSLLDGGMGAWVKDGNPVTTDVPPARTGTLSPLEIKPLIVDADFVQAHRKTPGFAIVDSRDNVYYTGAQESGPRDHRKSGHIADAKNVPFSEMTTDDMRIKSPDELEKAFAAAGVKPGDTVVTYCHIGQQATGTLFGAMTLGHPVRLYDGSFEDWARRDLPVETGPKKP